MKSTVRENIFETNSSSVHSFCLRKDGTPNMDIKHIHFGLGEFGWETEIYQDLDTKATYINTLLHECDDDGKLKKKITDLLDRYGITYDFEEPSASKSCWDYGIDHSFDHIELLHDILKSDSLFLNFLLGDGVLITDNDNGGFADADMDPLKDYADQGYTVYESNN